MYKYGAKSFSSAFIGSVLICGVWMMVSVAGAFEITAYQAVSNPEEHYKDYMGRSMAALGTDRFVAGASRYRPVTTNPGTAHLFDQSGTLLVTFTNPAPADDDHFGNAVACLGTEWIAVSAASDDLGATDAGAVYLFDTNGVLFVTITNPAPALGDSFGSSLAGIGSDRLVVSANADDGDGADSGRIYVYDDSGSLLTTVTNPLSAAGDRFGTRLAPMGTDKFLVGVPYKDGAEADVGAAYLYQIDGSLLLTITNPTPEVSDWFGCDVGGLGTNHFLVGASRDDTPGTNAGSVYLYDLTGSLIATITNPATNNYDYFGSAVCEVGHERILVGAPGAGSHNTGCAWIFDASGTLLAGMTNPAAGWDESFGFEVTSLDVDQYLVASPYAPSGGGGDSHKAGRVYIYTLEEGFQYYVNDNSTDNDSWCSAVGNDANSGTTTNEPKASVQAVIDSYDLGPSDTVYIDTGFYLLTNNITVTTNDGGSDEGLVTFVGSQAGATLDRGVTLVTNHYAFDLNNVTHVKLEHLTITNGFYGIYLTNADFCVVENLTFRDAKDVGLHFCEADANEIHGVDISRCKDGIYMFKSAFNTVQNSVLWSNTGVGLYLRDSSASNVVLNCTIAFNGYDQVDISGDYTGLELRNSIVVAEGTNNYCVSRYAENAALTSYKGNHNLLWAQGGASVGSWYRHYGIWSYRLADWQFASGQDHDSLSADPLFVDPGSGDLHLKSRGGRRSPGGSWVLDTVHSPCIDSGDSDSAVSDETAPNGARLNMGAYGGTASASRSDTNPYVHAIGLYDGGYVWDGDTVSVRWLTFNIDTSETLRIDYSIDLGDSWESVTDGLSVDDGAYPWTPPPNLATDMLYRVVLESDTSIQDVIDDTFFIKTPLASTFYVNDTSTIDDVFCTAVGDDANDGLTPASPKATLSAVRGSRAGRKTTILVDTGYYPITNNLFYIDTACLQGSPNGSVIDYVGSTTDALACITLQGASPQAHVVSDLIITGSFHGIECDQAPGATISNVTLNGIQRDGIKAWNSAGLDLYNIVVESSPTVLSAVYLDHSDGAVVDGLRVKGVSGHGLYLRLSDHCEISNVDISECGSGAITFGGSSGNELSHAVVYNNQGPGIEFVHATESIRLYLNDQTVYYASDSNIVEYCTIAHNQTMAQIYENAESGTTGFRYNHSGYGPYYIPGRHSHPVTLRNNIVVADGSDRYCFVSSQRYLSKQIPSYAGDYNLLAGMNGAGIGYLKRDYEDILTQSTLEGWQQAYGHDAHSVSMDPLFVDEDNDLHLRSSAVSGTYVIATSAWTNFSGENSPCIDMGDPARAFGNEPQPNGGVVNLGAYGNTAFASRSVDSDSDGLSDTLESHRIRSNPNDGDSDHDGVGDREELVAGMCPTNAGSVFRAQCINGGEGASDEAVIQWPSASGRTYRIERTLALSAEFEDLAAGVPATPPLNVYTDTLTGASAFYRVHVQNP